jgi:putative ABC transport system substrate-binding protein
MLRRREFIALLGGAVACPLATRAQQAQKVPRLCFLTFDAGTAQVPSARFEVFFLRLRELGYINEQTIAIEYLHPDGRGDRFPDLAADCVRLKPDVIAVTTTPAAHAAKVATASIPIVMLSLGDPVQTGLVESLARPGGNVTGMANMASELAANRLRLLKEAVPSVSRVLVLTYLVDPIAKLQVAALEKAATLLGVTLLFRDVRAADDLSTAFETAARDRADGLLTTTASIFGVERARTSRHRLPAIYPLSLHATDAGGLMAYHVDEPELLRLASGYVDSILKGAKPSELPVQQPTKFKLVINPTAKKLGIAIPQALLVQADDVIE